jgi:large subunit ribosomal protein L28
MSRVCEFCGKRTRVGNRLARRGLAKAKGGVGIKTTGINKRKFKPNVQRVRAEIDGTVKRVKICTRCLKTGKVQKPKARPKFTAAAAAEAGA